MVTCPESHTNCSRVGDHCQSNVRHDSDIKWQVLSGEGRGSSCIEWGRQGVVMYRVGKAGGRHVLSGEGRGSSCIEW